MSYLVIVPRQLAGDPLAGRRGVFFSPGGIHHLFMRQTKIILMVPGWFRLVPAGSDP